MPIWPGARASGNTSARCWEKDRARTACRAPPPGEVASGFPAAALFVPRTGSARDSMRTMTRNLPGHAGDALLRSGTSEPESAAEQADADRAAEQDTHDAPGPRGGDSHDPRSLEDKTRRSIAYLLIALPSDRKHVTARAERERAVYVSVTDASHLEELRRLFKRVELTPSFVGSKLLRAAQVEVTLPKLPELAEHPEVVAIVPNQKLHPIEPRVVDHRAASPDESKAGLTWGLDTLGAPELWKRTRGEQINVAVLDTGVHGDHPCISGRVRKFHWSGTASESPRGRCAAWQCHHSCGVRRRPQTTRQPLGARHDSTARSTQLGSIPAGRDAARRCPAQDKRTAQRLSPSDSSAKKSGHRRTSRLIDLDQVLAKWGGRRLDDEVSALRTVAVEATPAAIRILANLEGVQTVLEDQSVSLLP